MSATIDQQFIEFIVKSLVGKPDAVKVERRIDEKGVLLELTVDAEDLGRVIGKRGATAQSLRTLLRALGTKNDARYNLKIVDVNGDEGSRPGNDNDKPKKAAKKNDEPQKDVATEVTEDASAEPDEEAPSSKNESSDLDDLRDEDDIVTSSDDDTSDVISKTRKELEDLDDLDL